MANITANAYVKTLTTNEQAATGYTHVVDFGPACTNNFSAQTTVADGILYTLFTPNVGSVMVKWGLFLVPTTGFKDASDSAFNSTAISFGDSNSTTRFLSAVQCNENGTEVPTTYGNTAYVYATAYALQVTVASMAAKALSDLDTGRAVIAFRLEDTQKLAKASQI